MNNFFQNDEKLWESLKKGDHSAFNTIYQNHIQLLYNYGTKLSENTALIEDTIQDLFVTLWNSKERLSDTDSIKYYLIGAFRNNLIRALQQSQKKEITVDTIVSNDTSESILHTIEHHETEVHNKLIVAKQLAELSIRQQEAIHLKYICEHSYEEICSIMNINYQSVRNLISTGIKKMQENLKK